jgi:hypothetical protein
VVTRLQEGMVICYDEWGLIGTLDQALETVLFGDGQGCASCDLSLAIQMLCYGGSNECNMVAVIVRSGVRVPSVGC